MAAKCLPLPCRAEEASGGGEGSCVNGLFDACLNGLFDGYVYTYIPTKDLD